MPSKLFDELDAGLSTPGLGLSGIAGGLDAELSSRPLITPKAITDWAETPAGMVLTRAELAKWYGKPFAAVAGNTAGLMAGFIRPWRDLGNAGLKVTGLKRLTSPATDKQVEILQKQYPVANFIGNLAGQLSTLHSTGVVTAAAYAKVMAKTLPQLVEKLGPLGASLITSAIQTGTTFAVHSGMTEAARQVNEGEKFNVGKLAATMGEGAVMGEVLGTTGLLPAYARVPVWSALGYASSAIHKGSFQDNAMNAGIMGLFALTRGNDPAKKVYNYTVNNLKAASANHIEAELRANTAKLRKIQAKYDVRSPEFIAVDKMMGAMAKGAAVAKQRVFTEIDGVAKAQVATDVTLPEPGKPPALKTRTPNIFDIAHLNDLYLKLRAAPVREFWQNIPGDLTVPPPDGYKSGDKVEVDIAGGRLPVKLTKPVDIGQGERAWQTADGQTVPESRLLLPLPLVEPPAKPAPAADAAAGKPGAGVVKPAAAGKVGEPAAKKAPPGAAEGAVKAILPLSQARVAKKADFAAIRAKRPLTAGEAAREKALDALGPAEWAKAFPGEQVTPDEAAPAKKPVLTAKAQAQAETNLQGLLVVNGLTKADAKIVAGRLRDKDWFTEDMPTLDRVKVALASSGGAEVPTPEEYRAEEARAADQQAEVQRAAVAKAEAAKTAAETAGIPYETAEEKAAREAAAPPAGDITRTNVQIAAERGSEGEVAGHDAEIAQRIERGETIPANELVGYERRQTVVVDKTEPYTRLSDMEAVYGKELTTDAPDILAKVVGVKPDDVVTVYRAVAKNDPATDIQPGDWVAIDRAYSELHGKGGYGGVGSRIMFKQVRASDVGWAGTDWNEWYYLPSHPKDMGITQLTTQPGKTLPISPTPAARGAGEPITEPPASAAPPAVPPAGTAGQPAVGPGAAAPIEAEGRRSTISARELTEPAPAPTKPKRTRKPPTYSQAQMYDKKIGVAEGAKYPDYMELATIARSFGEQTAMNPKSIYDWAVEHDYTWKDVGEAGKDVVFNAVLNRETIERSKQGIAERTAEEAAVAIEKPLIKAQYKAGDVKGIEGLIVKETSLAYTIQEPGMGGTQEVAKSSLKNVKRSDLPGRGEKFAAAGEPSLAGRAIWQPAAIPELTEEWTKATQEDLDDRERSIVAAEQSGSSVGANEAAAISKKLGDSVSHRFEKFQVEVADRLRAKPDAARILAQLEAKEISTLTAFIADRAMDNARTPEERAAIAAMTYGDMPTQLWNIATASFDDGTRVCEIGGMADWTDVVHEAVHDVATPEMATALALEADKAVYHTGVVVGPVLAMAERIMPKRAVISLPAWDEIYFAAVVDASPEDRPDIFAALTAWAKGHPDGDEAAAMFASEYCAYRVMVDPAFAADFFRQAEVGHPAAVGEGAVQPVTPLADRERGPPQLAVGEPTPAARALAEIAKADVAEAALADIQRADDEARRGAAAPPLAAPPGGQPPVIPPVIPPVATAAVSPETPLPPKAKSEVDQTVDAIIASFYPGWVEKAAGAKALRAKLARGEKLTDKEGEALDRDEAAQKHAQTLLPRLATTGQKGLLYNLLEYIGGREGPMAKMVGGWLRGARKLYEKRELRDVNFIKGAYREAGTTEMEMRRRGKEVIQIGRHRLTKGEAAQVYNTIKSSRNRNHFKGLSQMPLVPGTSGIRLRMEAQDAPKKEYTYDEMKAIADFVATDPLMEKERIVADEFFRHMNTAVTDDMRATDKLLYGDTKQEKLIDPLRDYWGVTVSAVELNEVSGRLENKQHDPDLETMRELQQFTGSQHSYVIKNLFDTFPFTVRRYNNRNSKQPAVVKVRSVIRNDKLGDEIRRVIPNGKTWLAAVEYDVNAWQMPQSADPYTRGFERAFRRTGAAVLGAKIWIPGYQPISLITALTEIPVKYWNKAAKFWRLRAFGNEATNAEIRKYSPSLTLRFDVWRSGTSIMTPEYEAQQGVGRIVGAGEQVQRMSTWGIKKADNDTARYLWRLMKDIVKTENPGWTSDQVLRETAMRTEEIMDRTQPTRDEMTISQMALKGRQGERGAWIYRVLTLFTSQVNKNRQTVFTAVNDYRYSKQRPADLAKMIRNILMVTVAQGALVHFIRAGVMAALGLAGAALLKRRPRKRPTTADHLWGIVGRAAGTDIIYGQFAHAVLSHTMKRWLTGKPSWQTSIGDDPLTAAFGQVDKTAGEIGLAIRYYGEGDHNKAAKAAMGAAEQAATTGLTFLGVPAQGVQMTARAIAGRSGTGEIEQLSELDRQADRMYDAVERVYQNRGEAAAHAWWWNTAENVAFRKRYRAETKAGGKEKKLLEPDWAAMQRRRAALGKLSTAQRRINNMRGTSVNKGRGLNIPRRKGQRRLGQGLGR